MTGDRYFIDTNILVYAHDITAGAKCARARALVSELWESGNGCLSIQVLQELFVTLTRKVPMPLEVTTATAVVSDLSTWELHSPDADDLLGAIAIHRDTHISFWDAMIIRSATRLGAKMVYSEDLNADQSYGGVRVTNPFITA